MPHKIITIGREFGSGGREVGKRLAESLGIAYYDKEIMEEISKRTQLAESYLTQILEKQSGLAFPITVGRTLHAPASGPDYLLKQYADVYAEQANVLHEMAEKSDCVIVGRCADYILKDLSPTRIFVYADMPAKIDRCREKAVVDENLSDRELARLIRKVDKSRAKYYRYYTGQEWGRHINYDLCLNTSTISPKAHADALAQLLK